MDTDTYSDNEDIPVPSPDEPVFASSGGGMFAGSQYFTIAGGRFSNIIKNYHVAPAAPPDFRIIPMGDINLQKELTVNKESWLVVRRQEHNYVRRVYSATIDGRRSKVTVAVYQGDGAEDDWKRDTEIYMSVRHPNIIQVWAGASYGNMHTTVFHGDLVPVEQFLAPQSPIMTVYLYVCYTNEWKQVNDYFDSLWQRTLSNRDCTKWIQASTGRLSVDLVPQNIMFFLYSLPFEASLPPAATPSNITEVIAIESLGLRLYHNICSGYLAQSRHDSISTSATVHIVAVISLLSGHRDVEYVKIASLMMLNASYYNGWQISAHGAGDLTGNDWMRYRADDVFNTVMRLEVHSYGHEDWLSQANHIFSRLQVTSNLEDYTCVRGITFKLTIGNAPVDPPTGFLFVCPKEDFRTGPTSFRWPKCPAYWSLDPEGIEIISTEEAARLGFPPFQLATNIHGRSWDASVYAGLRKFHQAKGFDPDSQDVARHLGYPLYELSCDMSSPFAHVDDFETAEDTDTDDEWADAQSSLHKGSCDEGSDVEEGMGEDSICVESHEQQGPEVDQEPMDSGNGTNHQVDLKPQTANDHPTGGGFIHRIFGALRHSLVVEADNMDTDPISPFLI